MTHRITLLLHLSLTAILTACGGGDDTKIKKLILIRLNFRNLCLPLTLH